MRLCRNEEIKKGNHIAIPRLYDFRGRIIGIFEIEDALVTTSEKRMSFRCHGGLFFSVKRFDDFKDYTALLSR
jgi:hypothetical protein